MLPTKETPTKPTMTGSPCSDDLRFESLDQFASWIDLELEDLVGQFADFETEKSVRKFFTRS